MAEKSVVSKSVSKDDVIKQAKSIIDMLEAADLAELLEAQLAEASNLWAVFDVYNRALIALVRELDAELAEKFEATKATWPEARFASIFLNAREGKSQGWADYVMAQVRSEVAEYAKEAVEKMAPSREDAVFLSPAKRLGLDRAIKNGSALASALDPEKGAAYDKQERLGKLEGQIQQAVEATKAAWPKDLFEAKFVTPKPGHQTGWLEYVQAQVASALSGRPDEYRIDRAASNGEKILEALDAAHPYKCRKCHTPLTSSKFRYCDTCHKQWQAEQEAAKPEVAVEEGLHRAVSAGQTKKRRRHAERRAANKGKERQSKAVAKFNKAQQRQRDELGG